jgi:hypothetical protein
MSATKWCVSYCAEFITLFLRTGKLNDKEHYQINFSIEYNIEGK